MTSGWRYIALLVVLALWPGLAGAGSFPVMVNGRASCPALWVERNQILNVAGQCFRTPLGQAVFDNDDCWTTTPELNQKAQSRVAALQAVEARRGCAVDTAQTRISVFGRNGEMRFGQGGTVLGVWPGALRRLDVFPVGTAEAAMCTVSGLNPDGDGFLALRAGPDVRYRQIGRLRNGDRVGHNANCIGAWCFAGSVTRDSNRLGAVGWFHSNWCR